MGAWVLISASWYHSSESRFLIMGLPRSGTTYLMTLLNSHPAIHCSGEQFNPYHIVGVGEDMNGDQAALIRRDRDPVNFAKAFLENYLGKGHSRVGSKFMIGHNIDLLRAIEGWENTKIIYVWRENRLAQTSSLMKAEQTLTWAQEEVDDHIRRKTQAGPNAIRDRWHEYATCDYLFGLWYENLKCPRMAVEYCELFSRDFNRRTCRFLDVDPRAQMKSSLVKQGQNEINGERSANPF
jgi:LPS sulfotransferase NodH